MSTNYVGLDFGTTNSALALATPKGDVSLAQFQFQGQAIPLFRSVIYFSFNQRDQWGRAKTFAGPQAIEAYLEEDGQGRLLISPKSFLASAQFDKTKVLHTSYTQEEIVAILLRHLREQAEASLGPLGERVVAGRPVHFAGTKTPEDEERALQRLSAAYHRVGFTDVHFEFEPVAAAANYESSLERDELVLVGDFGGGTTDFCVIHVGPGTQHKAHTEKLLGTHGVAIAGDNFDSRIVEAIVAPAFGRGSNYRTQFGKTLPVPTWPYGHLNRWYLVHFLAEPDTLNMLYEVQRGAKKPKAVQAFIDFIEGNLGMHLYQRTEASKIELSSLDQSLFHFPEIPTPLQAQIQRTDFETWIDEEVQRIGECCDQLLEQLNLQNHQIDRVFLTGGSSFVPKVKKLFWDRFGQERMGKGDELTSVASGLARRAASIFA